MLCNENVGGELLDRYRKQFPEDECIFMESSGEMGIGPANSDVCYIEPAGETVDTFLDRLARSAKAGRNLFYEEWPVFEDDPEVYY